MKKINHLALLIAAIGITAGCNKESNTANPSGSYAETNSMTTNASGAWQNTKEGASNAWQSTKEGATNAWNATKNGVASAVDSTKEATANAWQKTKNAFNDNFSTNQVSTNYFGYEYSKKDAYMTEAQTSLADLDQRTSSLSNRLASASESTKANIQQTLDDLKEKRAELDRKYEDVKSASSDKWDDAKAAFSKAYYDVKADLKAAWDSLTSKM